MLSQPTNTLYSIDKSSDKIKNRLQFKKSSAPTETVSEQHMQKRPNASSHSPGCVAPRENLETHGSYPCAHWVITHCSVPQEGSSDALAPALSLMLPLCFAGSSHASSQVWLRLRLLWAAVLSVYLASQVAKNLKSEVFLLYLHNGVFVAERQCTRAPTVSASTVSRNCKLLLDLRSYRRDRLLFWKWSEANTSHTHSQHCQYPNKW